jgi:hypothetical protein
MTIGIPDSIFFHCAACGGTEVKWRPTQLGIMTRGDHGQQRLNVPSGAGKDDLNGK